MINTLKLLDKEKKNLSVLGIELFGDTGLLIHGRSSRSDQQRNENPMRGRRKQVKKKRCSLSLSPFPFDLSDHRGEKRKEREGKSQKALLDHYCSLVLRTCEHGRTSSPERVRGGES